MPISTKASNSRVSTDISFFSGVPLLLESAINFYLTDRIKAAGVQRMAARKALDSHPHTAGRAILFHRLAHVFGTARVIAASGWKHGRHRQFVETQKGDD
jgi:hypothetical protein